eukprot:5009571-Pyramimonas_sp.AAC.1
MFDAVCMYQEFKYDRSHPARSSKPAAGRYTDDAFGPEGQTQIINDCAILQYSDFTIHRDWNRILITHLHKNFDVAFSGDMSKMKETSLAPSTCIFDSNVRLRH